MPAKKIKPPVRDPNVPVLVFEIGDTKYEILIAGPKDYITRASNPKHSWTPNSMIVREWNHGLHEVDRQLNRPPAEPSPEKKPDGEYDRNLNPLANLPRAASPTRKWKRNSVD
jgi:hypothetical protein